MSLTIYGVAASRAFRVLWAARELGLAYEHVKHHYKGPEIKGPDYLAVHPLGVVPAIVDDGFALFESLAINLYLARKAGKLWPATLQGEGLSTSGRCSRRPRSRRRWGSGSTTRRSCPRPSASRRSPPTPRPGCRAGWTSSRERSRSAPGSPTTRSRSPTSTSPRCSSARRRSASTAGRT
ncbi:MAG: glutathione S-transferase [Betaproteobacteria bacterium]|nr:glutathione S-transferase [Betaproteobacteria bacterium]